MANSNIPATANQSLTSNTLSSVGRFAKIAGVGLIFGGFFGGLPAAMSIGTLLGATGTGLGLASQATSSQSLSLARAF
ncbi:MAG TPA: hypothetical protein PLT55_01030 [Acidimicrobiia bacterium]|nr:hypothetical protein [Acidimicrobiia bacterium]